MPAASLRVALPSTLDGPENLGECAVRMRIDNEADVGAGDFDVHTTLVNARPPIDDAVIFRVNCGGSNRRMHWFK